MLYDNSSYIFSWQRVKPWSWSYKDGRFASTVFEYDLMPLLMVWKKIYLSRNYEDSTAETARIKNTHFIEAPILLTE